MAIIPNRGGRYNPKKVRVELFFLVTLATPVGYDSHFCGSPMTLCILVMFVVRTFFLVTTATHFGYSSHFRGPLTTLCLYRTPAGARIGRMAEKVLTLWL